MAAGSLNRHLTFLKLGGSLITDKSRPFTARTDVIRRLAGEIKWACEQTPDLSLLIGHGSGSFGHTVANKYATREGVRTKEQWLGFLEVWRQAAALHRILIDIFTAEGLPVISFPPSSTAVTQNGQVVFWDTHALRLALQAGMIPMIYGDVVFDLQLGGTILSTEDLFYTLAEGLRPQTILLAGKEPGVWADYPQRSRLLEEITPRNFTALQNALASSENVDVTGGMYTKVEICLKLIARMPKTQVRIFSANEANALLRALTENLGGTLIRA